MSEPADKLVPPAEAAATAEPVAPVAVPEAAAEQSAPHEEPTPTATAAAPEPAAVTTTAAPAPEPATKIQVVDGPEPSSPLYDKLTAADKAAVKSLRAKLPEIFAEVNKDKPPTSVSIWGVELAPSSPPTAKESIVLYKFLKARNMVLADAQTMLLATLKWRQEIDIAAVLAESFPEDVFGKLGIVAGKDKDGRPVTYNLYSEAKGPKNAEVFGDVKRFIRWRVQLMERGIALLDFETIGDMVQVHDYSGLGSGDRTPESKVAASEAAATFTAHYPELLSRKFFCGVPTYLTWIFWFFKTIIPAQTFAKMQVVGTGKETIGKELLKVIDQEQLPVKYGGDLKSLE